MEMDCHPILRPDGYRTVNYRINKDFQANFNVLNSPTFNLQLGGQSV